MAIATRPPQTPVRPRSVADAPRRWPRRILIGLTVLAVLAVVAGAAWLRTYQPLVGGGTGSYGVQPARLVTSSFQANGWQDGSFVQYNVRMTKGATYRLGFPVWNDGPVAVTITGLAPGYAGERGDTMRRTLAGTSPMTGPQGAVRDAFAPFTLEPGQGIQLFVDVRVDDNAYDPGGSAGMNTVALEYTTFGVVHHEAQLFLGMDVEICKPTCGSGV